ncbi:MULTISPECIES: arginine repressor [Sellimonas]|uniref:Arginine repressor n=1 Tax=Sellimonas caecigallum TaxID=2592333 RepID=A0ABS7L6D8_9FIRM|nr:MULTISPECIES: arginine repressor [Sellimonas]MBY0758580.1 arginine repressor [Sellimonas caecigallum]OUP03319.1 arginine repressor [Drancourtella sp. An210]OUP64806.1 arginine repressor [Drancourtella sp. An177]
MKVNRHAKIVELIRKYDIETQEELAEYLNEAGFKVTQATVSRDIRDLKLTKVPSENGKQKYAVLRHDGREMSEKYIRVLRDGYASMDMAQNILIIKTVPGMAMAVAAAVDAMQWHEIAGSIAGDDTVMCAVRSKEETVKVMNKIRAILI